MKVFSVQRNTSNSENESPEKRRFIKTFGIRKEQLRV